MNRLINWLSTTWQDIPANGQDLIIFATYLLPIMLLGAVLFFRLRPTPLIKTLLKRYKKTNVLIVLILGVCLSVSIAIQATSAAYKTAMAKVANRFELVVTAPGSKIDMMLSTVYLQPVAAPLLMGEIYNDIANDPHVEVAAPIAYGDSYNGFPVVGSTRSFVKYLSENQVSGDYFTAKNQAIVGVGVDLNIGDTFMPQHGTHQSFAPEYSSNAPTRKQLPTTASIRNETTSSLSKSPPSTLFKKEKTTDNDNTYFCPDGSEGNSDRYVLKDHRSSDKTGDHTDDAGDIGDTDNKHAGHHEAVITVVGKMPVTHSPWDKAIITPVESVWAIHGLPTGHPPEDNSLGEPFDMDYFAGTPAILVHPKKRFQAYPLSMKYTTAKSMAFMPPTVLAKLNAQLDDITDIIARVAFITMCLVLSLAIVTIVLLGKLFEKHFQLLTALGSPKRFVVSILWGYVTTLALAATTLGCGLGYLLALVLSTFIESRLSVLLQVQFGWTELTLCAMFFALSSLMGLIPALRGFSVKS